MLTPIDQVRQPDRELLALNRVAGMLDPYTHAVYSWFVFQAFLSPTAKGNQIRAGYGLLERQTSCRSRKTTIAGVKRCLDSGLLIRLPVTPRADGVPRLTDNNPAGTLYQVTAPSEWLLQQPGNACLFELKLTAS